MLPNWLLGKSKSKLQEILGGGGGGTDYTAGDGIDISNGVISFDPETTPAIDPSKIDGLDDDLAALAPKTALSNPNILHNPWFTVNQRAFTTTTSNSQYPADRWHVYGDNPAYTLTRNSDGTITIDNTNGTNDVMFRQKRTTTYLNSLNGMKLTASVEFSDGTIISGTKIASSNFTQYINNEQMEVATWHSMQGILVLLIKPGASVTIKALKLELGEISTLAMDPRPEYALELAKCQRYFRRFVYPSASSWIAIGQSWNANKATFPMPFVQMRANPSVVPSNMSDWMITSGISTNNPHDLSAMEFSYGGLTVTTTDSTMDGTEVFNLRTKVSNAYIDLSAEL